MVNVVELRDLSKKVLSSYDIPMHPNLPLISQESLKCFKTASEVANKIVVLYCIAGIPNGADAGKIIKWIESENAIGIFDKHELKVMKQASDETPLSSLVLNDLAWKTESLLTLAWAGGLVDILAWPDQEALLGDIFSKIPPDVQYSNFYENFFFRKNSELEFTLDLYYCLHASSKHPEIWNGRNLEKYINTSVVRERRHALEWIFSPNANWNDITLDT